MYGKKIIFKFLDESEDSEQNSDGQFFFALDNFFLPKDNFFLPWTIFFCRQKKIVLIKLLRKTKIFVRLMKVEKARTNEKMTNLYDLNFSAWWGWSWQKLVVVQAQCVISTKICHDTWHCWDRKKFFYFAFLLLWHNMTYNG